MVFIDKMFEHCSTIYKEFEADSAVDNETGLIVWTGSIKQLGIKLNTAQSTISNAVTLLESMGCITRLKRGGGLGQAQISLRHAPIEDVYLRTKTIQKPRTRTDRAEDRIQALEASVAELTKAVKVILQQVNALLTNPNIVSITNAQDGKAEISAEYFDMIGEDSDE